MLHALGSPLLIFPVLSISVEDPVELPRVRPRSIVEPRPNIEHVDNVRWSVAGRSETVPFNRPLRLCDICLEVRVRYCRVQTDVEDHRGEAGIGRDA